VKEIFNRRSIRKFENKPVEKEKIDKLLRAAMQAPSAGNQQPWEFIAIENKETLDKLSEMTPYSKPVASSGVTFVLLANKNDIKIESAWQQDLSAAAENLLLEATYLELGAVWLGVSTLESAMVYVKDMFELPDYIIPFALIAVGYPDGQKNEFVDRYKADKVHFEKF
jgi:nitroreductase